MFCDESSPAIFSRSFWNTVDDLGNPYIDVQTRQRFCERKHRQSLGFPVEGIQQLQVEQHVWFIPTYVVVLKLPQSGTVFYHDKNAECIVSRPEGEITPSFKVLPARFLDKALKYL
jgi:hypothetical protein